MHGRGSINTHALKICPQIPKGGATNQILSDYCFENSKVHRFPSQNFRKNSLRLLKYYTQVKNVAPNDIQDSYSKNQIIRKYCSHRTNNNKRLASH